jgi:TIR domain-containing protein
MQSIGGIGKGCGSGIHVDSANSAGRRCRVFVSYARVDERYRKRLNVHLAPLVRAGLIDVWSDRTIAAGADWERDIQRELATADIVILLVTPNFVASEHCFERELPEAMRRHAEEGLRILPVLVKSVDLVNLPIGRFQGLPTDLRPISAWRETDDAWLQVAAGVRRAAEEVRAARVLLRLEDGRTATEPGSG